MYTDMRFCVPDLKPGFLIISDILQYTAEETDNLTTFERMLAYLADNDAGKIIWILDKTKPTFNQLVKLSKNIHNYTTIFASSPEDAEEKQQDSAIQLKRHGFRFRIPGHQIDYKTDQEAGTGVLVNISTSGCAVDVEAQAESLNPEDKVTLTIVFPGNDTAAETIEFRARVVRTEAQRFAAEFLDIDDSLKKQMAKLFAQEARRVRQHKS